LKYYFDFRLLGDAGLVWRFSNLDFLRRGEIAEKLELFFFSKIKDFSKAS
jgi:hypothetical protein